jgi:hypothetical protein
LETPPVFRLPGACFSKLLNLKAKAMIQLFIELTNQIFWDGYAEELAKMNPAFFQMELAEFVNSYNP